MSEDGFVQGFPPAHAQHLPMPTPDLSQMQEVRPRTFALVRDRDVTEVSGTGSVADGVLWPDGTVSIRWCGPRPSVVFWDSLEDAEQVHGHGGATRFVWDDEFEEN
ncbi:hypothetical protein ACWDRZ_24090 [Streptomyces sp. NPDC003509]